MASSSMSWVKGHTRPAASALFTHSPTVVGETLSERAIWRLVRSVSCASLRISLVFLMDNLLAGISSSFRSKVRGLSALGGYPARATSPGCSPIRSARTFASCWTLIRILGEKCPRWMRTHNGLSPSVARITCSACSNVILCFLAISLSFRSRPILVSNLNLGERWPLQSKRRHRLWESTEDYGLGRIGPSSCRRCGVEILLVNDHT